MIFGIGSPINIEHVFGTWVHNMSASNIYIFFARLRHHVLGRECG
jgi:hypothetical protein